MTQVSKKTLLITGANGFIGQALCAEAMHRGFDVRGAVRVNCNLPAQVKTAVIGSVNGKTDWTDALDGVAVVVHLAARAHIIKEKAADPLSEFRTVNVDGALNLARQAHVAGVRRFIFISSIKVNGEGGTEGRIYSAESQPKPVEPYGVSKYEAEEALRALASETGMEIVIIRPPLVFGPGVKANFHRLIELLDKGVPLPLGAINNRRSFVALDNLLDLIITCIDHPGAANQTFLAGDGEDFSTTDLLRRMATALGKTAWLAPVPVGLLSYAAKLLGKQAVFQRLCGSLQVDISKAREQLGWQPPVSVDEALRKTALHYMKFRQ
ncbi:MAG: UDP-glucose 4-epimerase family protein [Methylococcaceae bacterium]